MIKAENNDELKAKKPVRILDMFSGAGGMSLGWLRSTIRSVKLVGAVDMDTTLTEVFRQNLPGVTFLQHQFGDAFERDESEDIADRLGIKKGDADVILAGPPCQTFSAAGKRELGVESRLGYHVCDFARLVQPKIVLLENVPEFGRAEQGRLLGRLRVRLLDSGYSTEVLNLNAVDYGVPQVRMRCFTLAIHKDVKRPIKQDILEGLTTIDKPWQLKDKPDSKPTTVGEALGDLPPLAAGEGQQVTTHITTATTIYQEYLRQNRTCLFNHVAVQHSSELLAAMEKLEPGETPQEIENHLLRRKDYFRGAYARLDPDKPSGTMTTQTQNPGSGRFTHYRDHRVLTVREVARLQGFPDWFQFFGTQAIQRRHVGNAVPPLIAQSLASVLLSLMDV